MLDLDQLLRNAVERGASDVHIKVGSPPFIRVDGRLERTDLASVSPVETERIAFAIMPKQRAEEFIGTSEADFAYSVSGLGRFRVNVMRQRGSVGLVLRRVQSDIPSFEALGLPPVIRKLTDHQRGLVLVTGPTGSGKTTTLGSMIDFINDNYNRHIVTVEDPIEILHADKCSIVNQREVGIDTESYLAALRRTLRQDPDVILIGELRDAESAETALKAAESGHLVFSTLHTIDAAETLGRMIEFFPGIKQAQIRSILAGVLRGIVSQRLLPRANGGRVAAVEVMVNNARIADLIRESKTEEIPDAIAEGSFFQMQTFEQALIELVISGDIDREVAANAATNAHDFTVALEHALKRQAAGVTKEDEQPQAAPPEEETPMPSLRIASTER